MGFLNMNGARRTQKGAELYRALEEEGMSVYAVAETHLRDEEQPPVHQDWCWTGQNRSGNDRKGRGVGLLWRRGLRWKRQKGECRDHLWAVGELLGVPTAVCVLYLSVVSTHQAANAELLACVLNDARKWAKNQEIIIIGDFNGHVTELDGFTDASGRLLLQLADNLQLAIANLGQRCQGQTTWCARDSATTIDYALVSPRLSGLLQTFCIDEPGAHSLGSDHNRLLLLFAHGGQKRRDSSPRETARTYLPGRAIETVAAEFENSHRSSEAVTYDGFVTVLRSIMQRHMSRARGSNQPKLNRWWDCEVETAW